MPTIVHFEIPSDNVDRSKKFYSDLFGWNIEKVAPEKLPEQQGITNYIDVKSVEEYSSKVEQLGGKVRMAKMAVPGMGYLAVCSDTENNTFGLWENDTTAK